MVASEELELRPGETVELKLSVEEGSRYVGVLAAYRDLPETKWRYTVQVTRWSDRRRSDPRPGRHPQHP
jgi:type VI secretion system protein VasD